MERNQKSLVACSTHEIAFSNRIELAAKRVDSDFFSSDNLSQTFHQCGHRSRSCVVVDFDITSGTKRSLLSHRVLQDHLVLVAIPHGNTEAAFQAATIGAVGVFDRRLPADDLSNRLEMAFQSEKILRERDRFDHSIFQALTGREKGVLQHLIDGEPNKRVAAILDIGLRTVEADRAHIMRKLNVKSFVDLVKFVTTTEQDVVKTRQAIFESISQVNLPAN